MFLELKKKTSHTVDHNIVYRKWICTEYKEWLFTGLSEYLTNRNICLLQYGVPQATIRGPLVFIIYINHLANCFSSSQLRVYADDTHITCVGADVMCLQLNLNHDLDNLNKWLISNELTLNTTKIECMLKNLSNPLELSIDNVPIEQVSSAKSLRLFVDEKLSWQTHIDELSE